MNQFLCVFASLRLCVKRVNPNTLVAVLVVFVAGCTHLSHNPTKSSRVIHGESVVLAGETPAHLAFGPLKSNTVDVRSTYRDNLPETIHYEAGRDYVIDATNATIRRTAQSRIPDFTTNILYGKTDFDHSKFPGYGNGRFLAFVDYTPLHRPAWPVQKSQADLLPRTREKLRAGGKILFAAFGDSITAGGEASEPSLIYWQRWADELQREYPRAKVIATNVATGGDTTANGLARLQEKVLAKHPDLVLIAFGMNDANRPPFGVPVATFAGNLRQMIDRIRSQTDAEIILTSAFPPNPNWHWASGKMEEYAWATEEVAREKRCAYAYVYNNWLRVAAKKKPEDLLGNNINHPNDFGHWIYFEVFNRLGL